jgi:fatty-acyl-CoA synthase
MIFTLSHWARITPKAVALRDMDTGRSFGYRELSERSEHLAAIFSQRGIGHGDRVALLAPNEVETVFLFFALQRLGAILVPLNWRLSERELSALIQDADPKILILHPSLKDKVSKTSVELLSFGSLAELLFSDPLLSCEFAAKPSDPVMLLYTSGTTGVPKGALLSNQMIFWNSFSTALRLELSAKDSTLIFHPFFHTSGWNVLTLPLLQQGATVLFLKKFEPARVLSLIASEQISVLFAVPTMMAMMSRENSFLEFNCPRLRYAIVGGEAMPIPLIKDWSDKGVPVRQGFGMTEFGPNVFSLPEADALRKRGSIGFANHGIELRLVTEAGADALADQIGELWLKGPAMMSGYWRNPEATNSSIVDGWFRTGDLLSFDKDGYYFVVGRKKDMYISGAENVYPAEVEQFLVTHAQIKEAAVIGVKDEQWGEVGHAFIVTKGALSDRDVLDYCNGNLAKFKIPKHISFLAELPKNANGKIAKKLLL